MAEISVRELRSHTSEVLRRVEAGERLLVTVNGRPIAEITPLARRSPWVPREGVVATLLQADAGLLTELHELGDPVEDP